MKKIIALFLVIATCVSVFACGNSNSATTTATTTTTASTTTVATTETATTTTAATTTVTTTTAATTTTATTVTTEAPKPIIPAINLKKTISTDIVDFTLLDSTFTYYVSNVSTNYGEPTDKPNSLYAAKIGTCYVSMTVTIKNKDRGGSLDFCGNYWNPGKWSVNYNGETYPLYGYDLSVDKYRWVYLNYGGAIIDPDTGKVSMAGTRNKLIY